MRIDAKDLAISAARVLDEKQATDILILDVSGPLVIADCFVVCTARNPRHARALAMSVEEAFRQLGLRRRNVSGIEGESPWVLLDFDDVVIHVFVPEARAFYRLEDLWADVPRVPFAQAQPAAEAAPGTGGNQENWPGTGVPGPLLPT